jgi:hypothetical protein
VFEIVHFPPTISIPALFHGVSNCLLDITRASWMEVSPYAGDSLFAKARGYRRRWLLIALERSIILRLEVLDDDRLGGLERAARRRPQIGRQGSRPYNALFPPEAGGDE